jgi:hypothetical protein
MPEQEKATYKLNQAIDILTKKYCDSCEPEYAQCKVCSIRRGIDKINHAAEYVYVLEQQG